MKKIKSLAKLLLLCLVVSLTNCQKDESELNTETSDEVQDIISRTLSLEAIQHYTAVREKFDAINVGLNSETNLQSRTIDTDSVTVLPDDVLYMSYAETHTYTFKLLRENPLHYVENIVLHYNVDAQDYDEYLVQYNVSFDEYQDILNGLPLSETAEVDIYELNNGTLGSLLNRSSCFLTCQTVSVNCTAGGNHSYGEACSGETDQQPYQYQACGISCFDGQPPLTEDPTPGQGGGGNGNPNGIVVTNPNAVPCDGGLSRDGEVGDVGGDGCITTAEDIARNFLFDRMATHLTSQIHADWIALYADIATVNSLNSFLDDNIDSPYAKEEANLKIYKEYADDTNGWIAQTGTYNNRPGLEFTHIHHPSGTQGTMFQLQNGDVLFSTTVKRIISRQDGIESLTTIPTTDGDQYHYVYKQETKRWYKAILPPQQGVDCLSCALEDFFQAVLSNGGIILGRYVLPIEDAYIVVTGEDFDGVESSRAQAAGFLLLDLIPGTAVIKGIKLVKYGDEVIDAAQIVIKYADELYKIQKDLVKDVLDGTITLINNTRKGNFGEIAVDVDLYEKGYTFINRADGVIDLDDTSIFTNGIDHIVKDSSGEFVIIETKYNTSQLASNTNYGAQMSEEWISHHLNNLPAEMAEVGQDILIEGYTSVLAKVAPDGSITYSVLDNLGQSVGPWTP